MTTHTNIQVINNKAGLPEFVIMPYSEYRKIIDKKESLSMDDAVPGEVVKMVFINKYTTTKAWRIHLELLPEDLAEKLGISQQAYLQYEQDKKLKKATLKKIADAFGINVKQLMF